MASSREEGREEMGNRGMDEGRRRPLAGPASLPVLLVLIMIAVITFLYSPAFDVREVTVSGNRHFSAEEVEELARVPRDRNMLLIRSEGIIGRLTMAPRIETAAVKKRYPSKLEIIVTERRTVAYLPYGGFFMELDLTGLAIGVREAITDPNVPIITGVEPTFALLGEKVEPAQQVDAACNLGYMLQSEGVPNVSEVNVKDMLDIVIITNEGSSVLLGAVDGIEERFAVAVDILSGARARKQAFKYIDVRIADRPVLGTR